jgi:hypothetical protein
MTTNPSLAGMARARRRVARTFANEAGVCRRSLRGNKVSIFLPARCGDGDGHRALARRDANVTDVQSTTSRLIGFGSLMTVRKGETRNSPFQLTVICTTVMRGLINKRMRRGNRISRSPPSPHSTFAVHPWRWYSEDSGDRRSAKEARSGARRSMMAEGCCASLRLILAAGGRSTLSTRGQGGSVLEACGLAATRSLESSRLLVKCRRGTA